MLPGAQNSLSAVRAHTRGLLTNAHNIANAQTEGFEPQDTVFVSRASGGVRAEVVPSGETEVDLASEMIEMGSSQRAIEANIAVVRSTNATLGVLIDTLV
jgi:flagellar basal body rod protein FlgG